MLAPALPSPHDRQLAHRIAAELAQTGRSTLHRLAVEVRPGRITLRGRVQTFYEKQLAIQTCLAIAGGESLVDAADLTVQSPPTP